MLRGTDDLRISSERDRERKKRRHLRKNVEVVLRDLESFPLHASLEYYQDILFGLRGEDSLDASVLESLTRWIVKTLSDVTVDELEVCVNIIGRIRQLGGASFHIVPLVLPVFETLGPVFPCCSPRHRVHCLRLCSMFAAEGESPVLHSPRNICPFCGLLPSCVYLFNFDISLVSLFLLSHVIHALTIHHRSCRRECADVSIRTARRPRQPDGPLLGHGRATPTQRSTDRERNSAPQ